MARIIISYLGGVKVEQTDDATTLVQIGDEKILNGIWSIFEEREGRVIHLTIEEVNMNDRRGEPRQSRERGLIRKLRDWRVRKQQSQSQVDNEQQG